MPSSFLKDIPPKNLVFVGFGGDAELFDPHRFTWKTPTPSENIGLKNLGCALFSVSDLRFSEQIYGRILQGIFLLQGSGLEKFREGWRGNGERGNGSALLSTFLTISNKKSYSKYL